MSSLTLDGTALIYRTPYNPALVADLKAQVPATDRQWDANTKAWRVAPQHATLLVSLTEQHLGEHIPVPQVSQLLSKNETRILEVRYIGATKDRGGDERSAFGYMDGAWKVIFPETVLRNWFDAPLKPDEQLTLYQVLSIKQGATPDEVKSAYRRLSRQWHPDVCREPGASEVFMHIKNAYDLLSDAAKRRRYDAGLALQATLGRGENLAGFDNLAAGYRSPLRCGLLMCEGQERLGRFVVAAILAWEDITNAYGQTLSTSWVMGADKPLEVWL